MLYRLVLLGSFLIGSQACTKESSSDALFTQVRSDVSGVTFNNQMQPFENDTLNANTYDPMYNGAGVGVGDFNRDGLQDIFFAGNNVTSKLYLNKGKFSFEDVTKQAGVTTKAWCTGVCVADVNQDGWPDVYVSVAGRDTSHAIRHNLLFINVSKQVGGNPTFREMAAEYGLDDSGMNTQAAFFDYDRDGDLDCYVLNNAVERTGRNTIRPKRLHGEGLSTDRLYRNMTVERVKEHFQRANRRAGSLFENISREAGILAEGYGLGLTIADINQDGWLDVYCANDFLSNDVAYINNGRKSGNATFTDQSSAYFKHTSYNSMGVDIQDINNDTRPDVIVVDMLPESNARQKMMLIKTNWEFFHLARQQGYQDEYVRNTLQLNQGNGPNKQPVFSEIGQLADVFRTDWSWAPLLADFDNDGFKDLFVTNGYRRDITNLDYVAYLNNQAASFGTAHTAGSRQQTLAELYKLPTIQLHNYLFRNKGDLTFEDKSEEWGFGELNYSNGAAYADLDNDGDLDLVINNMDSEAGLYRNETIRPDKPITSHFLRLHLPADAHGLGATVQIKTLDGQIQSVQVHPIRGYASSVEPFVHVGLGKHVSATISIRWADGTYQELGQISTDRLHKVAYKPTATFPPTQPIEPSLFSTVDASTIGLTFRHQEAPLNDFERTPLLHQVYGKNSPSLAIADADGNGLDDVFVGADAGQVRSLFLQMKPGHFVEQKQGANDLEDMGSLFFDADGDGDQDLYVVSGGSRLPDSSAIYQDRLYLNDGRGKLTRAQGVLPPTTSSGSCLVAADFDGDGDLDLFRAGRVKVGQYPLAPASYLLRNDGNKTTGPRFTDVTNQSAPGLQRIGMVCAALWTDFDNDNDPDLLVAGEFMPITLFTNDKGRLTPLTLKTPDGQGTSGLWNSVTGRDFDLDGDIDYIVGNLGQNTRYHVSPEEPLRLYAKDFDGNGQLDPILTHYLQGEQHIAPIRDVLNDQMPTFARKRFTSFQQFANSSFANAFNDKDLDGAVTLTANELRSCYVENRGKAGFVVRPLPTMAQISPVFGVQPGDFNGDGLPDVLLVGNSYASETYSGWYDAGRGCLLLGDGRGSFRTVPPDVAGIHADGDAKALAMLSTGTECWYVVSNNNGPIQLIKPTKPVKPQPAKPGETYRLIKHPDGRTERREFYYGSGYLSQSSR
ncbi:VCBS repeat-containing protein [Spirosoma sp. BT702]|uniref:VCBS repeat-containing protein n=1 Tax=Spirosoma profusum TaxID=2771354 RepID=A0A927AU86_9BACT|nr:VCBS repeat-containing protein [Spirosoma profusum]MBD2703002.1 VCBS repeat-containing protein [Spirosoma profusum]